jgi:hypothetical protein
MQLLDASATVLGGQTSVALTVGASFIAGDKRIVRVTISAAQTFGSTPAGWTLEQDQVVTGSRRVGIFSRVLQAGDADATLSFGGTTGYGRTTVTLRGWDTGQTFTFSTTGSSTGSASVVAPSVTTGAGSLLTWHDITLTTGANTATMTDPGGMTRQAFAPGDAAASYNQLICSEARTSGASGTRTATSSGSGSWAATSLFVAAQVVTGAASADLGALTAAASGVHTVPATTAAPLGTLTASASGTVTPATNVAVPLGGLTAAASGTIEHPASAAAPLGGLAVAATGSVFAGPVAAAPLGGLAVSGSAVRSTPATGAVTLGGLTVAAAGVRTLVGAVVAAPLGALTATAAGGVVIGEPPAVPPLSPTVTVYTTIRPDVALVVDRDEYFHLGRYGILTAGP